MIQPASRQLPSQQGCTHDLKGVGNDADGLELLAVVAAVHHERVGEALNDGAVGLAESLDSISAGGVRNVDRGTDLDVIAVLRCSSAQISSTQELNKCQYQSSACACSHLFAQEIIESRVAAKESGSLTSGKCRGSQRPRSSIGLSGVFWSVFLCSGELICAFWGHRRTEELDAANLGNDVLGKDLVTGNGLDLDLAVRHLCCNGWRFADC